MIAMLMGSMPAHAPPFPDCSSDFALGVTCGVIVGFALATVVWIVIHHISR